MKKKLTKKNVPQVVVNELKKRIEVLESQNGALKLENDVLKQNLGNTKSALGLTEDTLEREKWRQETKEELKDSGYENLVDPQPQPKKPWWKRLF